MLSNYIRAFFVDSSSVVTREVMLFRFFKAEARPWAIGRRPQKREGSVWAQNDIGPSSDNPRPMAYAKAVSRLYGPRIRRNLIWKRKEEQISMGI